MSTQVTRSMVGGKVVKQSTETPFSRYENKVEELREFELANETVIDKYQRLRDQVEEAEKQAKDYARNIVQKTRGEHVLFQGTQVKFKVVVSYNADTYSIDKFRKEAGKAAEACIRVVKEDIDLEYTKGVGSVKIKEALEAARIPGEMRTPAVYILPADSDE